MCFHKSSLLWQLIWMEDTSDYYIKARKGAKLYLGLGSNLSASGLAIRGFFRNNVDILNNFTMLCSMVIKIISICFLIPLQSFSRV